MALSTTMVLGLGLLGPVPTASAACAPDTPIYVFTNDTKVWKQTSLRSSYVTGPGSVSLKVGRDFTVSASMTATVEAEAGVIFAKASASLGITVGVSSSSSLDTTYTLDVAKGQRRALQQYKRAVKFTVTKKTFDQAKCAYVKKWSSSVTAPVKSNADRYFLYQLVS